MARPASIENQIKAETKRLTKIFADIDANKLSVVKPLIERAAFITVHLRKLEEELNEEGWTEEYQNGKEQVGMKKSAKADVHISLTKNLTAISKQLVELCPVAQQKSRLAMMMEEDDG